VTDILPRQRRPIRTAAWVILGLSVLVAAIELWVNSPASASIDFFGIANTPEGIVTLVIATYALWLLAGVIDVVFFIVLRGWRNRVIVLGGIVAVLVPLAYIFWRLNF
jgi:hypothetical protein